jgi:hypothetical protein
MKPALIITGFVMLAAGVTWTGWCAGRNSLGEKTSTARRIPVSSQAVPAPVTGDYAGPAEASWQPRRGRTLAEILALAEKLRFSPALETQGELLALLGGLEPDEIVPALEALKKLPPPVPSALLEAVLTRWAAGDGPAAIAWMQQNLNAKQRDDVRGGILSAWASHDPKATWQWYLKAWADAPEPRYRLEQDFPLLIHAWARQDLKGALQACLSEEKHGTYDGWSGLGGLAVLPEYREPLMQLITTETMDDKKRQAALRSTLLCWARMDPVSAAVWLDSYAPSKNDGNLVWSVAEYYGSLDPKANADWLLKRTPPEKKDEVLSYGLSYWSRADPEAAGEWLEKAGVSDMGAEMMATAWARRDLDRAVGWARRASAEKRADAVAGAIASAGVRSGESGDGKTTPDVSKYAEAAGVPAEDLAKRVEKLRQVWGSRL